MKKSIIYIIIIQIIFASFCKHLEQKNIQGNKEDNAQESNKCPKNLYEFYKNFIFYEEDKIEQKAELRAKHYPTSNERRIDLFYPFIKDKKGGYIGVGTDQNLTFIAWAKSDYAYLMDFDWVVIYVNRLHLLFIKNSENFQDFKKLWSKKNQKYTIEKIKESIQNQEEQKKYLYAYNIALPYVQERFRDLEYMSKNFNFTSFHNNPEDFEYLKKMVNENKIYPVLGDINGTITFRKISEASKNLCVPIHIVYLSNAEEYYRYPNSFRDNIINLNYDKEALIIRTVTTGAKQFGYPEGEKYLEIPFHYNIQSIHNLVQWFKQPNLWIFEMLKYRTDIQKGFSIVDKLPLELSIIQTSQQ